MTWNTSWGVHPDAAALRLGERYPGAESLVIWAALTVEGLHYLAELDAELPRPPPGDGFRVGRRTTARMQCNKLMHAGRRPTR